MSTTMSAPDSLFTAPPPKRFKPNPSTVSLPKPIAVVLDLEGVLISSTHYEDVIRPYSISHLRSYLMAHTELPYVRKRIEMIKDEYFDEHPEARDTFNRCFTDNAYHQYLSQHPPPPINGEIQEIPIQPQDVDVDDVQMTSIPATNESLTTHDNTENTNHRTDQSNGKSNDQITEINTKQSVDSEPTNNDQTASSIDCIPKSDSKPVSNGKAEADIDGDEDDDIQIIDIQQDKTCSNTTEKKKKSDPVIPSSVIDVAEDEDEDIDLNTTNVTVPSVNSNGVQVKEQKDDIEEVNKDKGEDKKEVVAVNDVNQSITGESADDVKAVKDVNDVKQVNDAKEVKMGIIEKDTSNSNVIPVPVIVSTADPPKEGIQGNGTMESTDTVEQSKVNIMDQDQGSNLKNDEKEMDQPDDDQKLNGLNAQNTEPAVNAMHIHSSFLPAPAPSEVSGPPPLLGQKRSREMFENKMTEHNDNDNDDGDDDGDDAMNGNNGINGVSSESHDHIGTVPNMERMEIAMNGVLSKSEFYHESEVNFVVQIVEEWMNDEDQIEAMQYLLGLVVNEGFKSGALRSGIFEDAFNALQEWRDKDLINIYIYNKGSIAAQRLLIRYSQFGDLSAMITDYFDLDNIGSKKTVTSFERLYDEIRSEQWSEEEMEEDDEEEIDLLYVSSDIDELRLAENCGFFVLQSKRDGVDTFSSGTVSEFPQMSKFSDIQWTEYNLYAYTEQQNQPVYKQPDNVA